MTGQKGAERNLKEWIIRQVVARFEAERQAPPRVAWPGERPLLA